ncbi:hypothetical protein RhiirA5_433310 [Rhizophagus irregularis]|uniref:Uncharacterized protein n=2 Tax=Rhizophagus irregularis TaxID=588596 RepID=A0A2N0NS23_9GLOM|nr:hypothetical protein RirG_121360 [Rhizophagus irregularis DAOM 197198w]PKB97352.1 hypothetical protein RhiirA5_433310 [Rhizophagus irregularis]GBC30538.1 hypothetical protein RIR_jg31034.t1 [Rhizophagus irregularis DAOM 181602=DAOM 197198]CAB4487554.1 unnamed protein product [Rhizophagus irregularis]
MEWEKINEKALFESLEEMMDKEVNELDRIPDWIKSNSFFRIGQRINERGTRNKRLIFDSPKKSELSCMSESEKEEEKKEIKPRSLESEKEERSMTTKTTNNINTTKKKKKKRNNRK